MFWANNYVSSPHIEALLNKEDVTLHELMDEEDILQECKSQNKKLIEYLTRSDIMEELITLTTKEPSTDIEERWRYKYPNVACELLTCDVPVLNEALAGNETLLAKLYSFIDTDQPLNPLLASFFSKTIGVLIARKAVQNWYSYQFTCLQFLEFLKSRETCVDLLLQHLETSAIMDLVLKLVSQVEGSMRQNVLNWLNSEDLVQRVVKLLSPNSELSKHANAAQLLCDMIIAARDHQCTSTASNGPDPLLKTLESPDTVCLLLETILTGEKLESSITGGIQVLLTLLQKANNGRTEDSFYDEIAEMEKHTTISSATLPYLEQLHKLLIDPPYKPPIKTTTGVLECPVGMTRLHVTKLFTKLLAMENVKIYETFVKLGTFQTLLDLFFKYTWNTFLHAQVQFCLAFAIICDFEDINNTIYTDVFINCRLIERILETWDKKESTQNNESQSRPGYMGHLINIANNIVNHSKKSKQLDQFLKDNLSSECLGKWEDFVNTELSKINKTHQILLGGQPQTSMTSSSENPDEYSSYPQEEYLQVQRVEQCYANYVGQHMTPQFTENFGFHDDQFNDGDDALHNSVDQLTTMAFNLSEEDLDKREDMFNKICQQKQKADLEDCTPRVEWGDEGELTFQTVVDKRDWPTKQQNNDSNSSDEDDEDPRDMHMEIDSAETWVSTEPLYIGTTVTESNPWEAVAPEPVESTGWANFDNFENSLSMGNTVIIDNKSSDENKSSAPNTVTHENEEESTLGSKVVIVATTDSGDTKVVNATDSTASHAEANTNHESTENNLFPSCTEDNNANPSEIIDSRETKCGESVNNTELAAKVQMEVPSTDIKSSCNLKNTSSDAALPSTDAK